MESDFEDRFTAVCEAQFPHLFRYLHRLSGEPDLASDLAQEALVRLFRRGSMPDEPEAWLVSVAMNLFRNERTKRSRRLRLLSSERAAHAHADAFAPPSAGVEADEERASARAALARLPERERQLLLLRAEGFSYKQLASILELHEGSVGTLLARAREAFHRELCHAAR